MVKLQSPNRWPTAVWGGTVLILLGLSMVLIVIPYYVYGINYYTYADIIYENTPATGYPALLGPLELLVLMLPTFDRWLLPVLTFGLLITLRRDRQGLTKYERFGWSLILLSAMVVVVIMWSYVGSLMETWVKN